MENNSIQNEEVNSTTINIISNKANNFLKSDWAYVSFLGGMSIITILNLFLFGFGEITIDTVWWGSINSTDSNSWLGWLEICFAGVGSTLTIWGVIWTLRFDKRFIFPLMIGETMVVIDAIVLGWTFTAISYILMMISAMYNYILWNKEDDNISKMDLFNWIMVGAFIIIYSIGGIGLSMVMIEGKLGFVNYNDVISSGIVVASWYVILRKSKWGFVTFVATDILYLFAYLSVGVWATGFSYLVYLFIDSTSFISWWNTN